MRERHFGSAVRWASFAIAAAVGTHWAWNPPETSALIQLREVNKQAQSLSGQLHEEGALVSGLLGVQVIDASNPRMPQLAALIKQERGLSQQIKSEQGPIQAPLRGALGFIGPLLAVLAFARTAGELLRTGSRHNQA